LKKNLKKNLKEKARKSWSKENEKILLGQIKKLAVDENINF
jgi:hypothetical protein